MSDSPNPPDQDPRRTSSKHAPPRVNRPRPPSTRPPTSMRSLASQEPHTLYVRMANLQMARTRQQRIRSALQAQVNDCTQRIREIDEKVDAIKAEIQKTEASRSSNLDDDASAEDGGFEYEY
ncbi:MAG: hypothetical protein R6U20_10320 [Longimonas sp.]|uniref:hypothetical protein n=1 Tax=Longimonas sp. TaxID=2039626 RepID=UPI00397609C4